MWIEKDENKGGQCLWDNGGNVYGGIVMGVMFLRKCLRRNNKGLLLKCLMIWISLKYYCYRATHRGSYAQGGNFQLHNNVHR